MSEGSEVGIGYVTLVASGKGIVGGIQKEMAGVAGVATSTGATAGAGLGAAFKTGLAGVAVAAGVVATIYAVGKQFEGMSHTIIKATGASGVALDGLEKSAKNVASRSGASFKDIGTAIGELATRTGLSGKPLEDLSLKFIKLSKVTGTDLKTNIKDITRTFGDWSIATKDQPAALDKILKASQSTGIGINQLTQQVVQFGAPLRQMGFSFETSVAMFARFEKEGVNITTVLSGMKMGLKNFAKAGEDPPAALRRISEEIKNASTVAEANTLAFKVFGARAGPDMAAAIREGRFDLEALTATIMDSGGTIDDTAKRTRTLTGAFNLLKNKALVGLEPIATRAFAAVTTGVLWLADTGGPALSKVAGIVDETLKPVFAAIGDIFTSRVLPVLKQFAGYVTGTVIPALTAFGQNKVVPAVKAIAAAFIELVSSKEAAAVFAAIGAAARVMGPILVDIAGRAFGAINAAFEFFAQHGTVTKTLLVALIAGFTAFAVISTILAVVSAAVGLATAVFGAFGVVLAFVTSPIGIIVLAVAALAAAAYLIYKNWAPISAFFAGLWASITGPVAAAVDFIKNAWTGVPEPIRAALAPLFAIISEPFKLAFEFVKAGIAIFKAAISGDFGAIPGIIDGALGKVGEIIKAPFQAGYELVKDVLTTLNSWTGGKLGEVAGIVKSVLAPIAGFIETPFKAGKLLVTTAIELIRSGLSGDFGKWPGIIRGAIAGLAGIIEKPFKDAWSAVTGWVNKIREKIKGLNPFAHMSPAPADSILGGWRKLNRELGTMMGQTHTLTASRVGDIRSTLTGAISGSVGSFAVPATAMGPRASMASMRPSEAGAGSITIQQMTVVAPDPRKFMEQLDREIALRGRARGGR